MPAEALEAATGRDDQTVHSTKSLILEAFTLQCAAAELPGHCRLEPQYTTAASLIHHDQLKVVISGNPVDARGMP